MKSRRFKTTALQLLKVLAAAALAGLPGCVERLLQVRTDPQGAEVTVNGEPATTVVEGKRVQATTPVDIPFDYYGTFEITVRREGFLSESRMVPVHAPFYEYMPLDFFAENFVPWTIRDHRPVEFQLKPAPDPDEKETAELLRRMSHLRSNVLQPEREEQPKEREGPEGEPSRGEDPPGSPGEDREGQGGRIHGSEG